MSAVLVGLLGVVTLTALGWRDRPLSQQAGEWSAREIGGRMLADSAGCGRCHVDSGLADPLEQLASTPGPEWLAGHVTDPEMIAPGLREPPTPPQERETAAILAYVQRLARDPYPGFDPRREQASAVYAKYCIGCHELDGEGGDDGPSLSRVGAKHDGATLRRWIADPEAVDPMAEMPAFGGRLTSAELDAIAGYLASRK